MKAGLTDIPEWQMDFKNPEYEGRRLFSEVVGTFFLALVGVGAHVVDAASNGGIGRAAAVVAPGLMVMAIILFMGKVSGAHLNLAVTIGFAARGDFPWRRVPGYLIAQLLGALLACLFLYLLFGQAALLPAASRPGEGFTVMQAFAMEAVLTFGLISTILGTASRAQNVGYLSALAIGGYIALAGLWSSPISGASMNPTISLSVDLVLLDLSYYWIYLIAPLAGTIVAVLVAHLLRGPGGDETARKKSQGEPETASRER